MTTYTKAFFGQADNPDFDLRAAVDAYEWVLAHPEEAPFVVSKMLFDNTSTLMEYYAEPISKAVDGYVSKRLSEATLGLSRSVSKSATDALGVVEAISKAWGKDSYDRDAQGQFAAYEGRRAKRKQTKRLDRPVKWGDADQDGRPYVSPQMRAAGLDALTAMTSAPGFSEYVMRTAGEARQATGSFEEKWGRKPEEDRGVNDQTWRRLEASSKLAYDMGGKYLPEQAQFALKVGEWAGNYAPQAERVIGPTARRASYRYRGVEKQPDPVFQRDIDTLRVSQKGGRAAHEALIYGTPSPTPKGQNPANGMWDDRSESRTITRMKELLPDASLYELSRKSGTIPPSQGIIIDRSGKVVTEAVGYGEDWYLPFNLKNLSRLKGGEYIRTRAYGGLTTEDIYVGLVSGARAVTVVSHSGTYTMEFDDTFRGARRYNDKAGRMHARYAQLLDAVKSGDVQMADISPARTAELIEEAATMSGLDPDDEDAVRSSDAFKRLRIKERKNPTLAKADVEAATIEGINQHLLDSGRYRNFDQYSDETGQTDPIEAAKELGAQREVARAVAQATKTNADNLNPLLLNGRGYGKAMEALKQQFPYYISRADFIAPGGGRTDQGYIKPKFIRPAGALSGYYDKTIDGGEKLHADRTNYQNYSVIGKPSFRHKDINDKEFPGWDYEKEEDRLDRKASEDEVDEAPAPREPRAKTPDPTNDKYAAAAKTDATMALVRALRANPVAGPAFGADAGQTLSESDRQQLASLVFGGTEDEIEEKLDDPAFASALDAQLKRLRNWTDNGGSGAAIEVSPALWNEYSSGGQTKVIPLPDNAFEILRGIGKQTFEIGSVKRGLPVSQYDKVINQMLQTGELATIGATEDDPTFMSADKSYADVSAAIRERADILASKDREIEMARRGQRVAPPAGWSSERVLSEARRLATLSQAFQERDAARAEAGEAAEAAAPKAEAPEAGADIAAKLKAAAAPHQEKIHSMIGLDDVAVEVDKLAAQAIISQRRKEQGLKVESRPKHLIFTGNPGTGKTTVAEVIAPLYHDLGLLEKPTVKTLTKSELTGPYNNQVEENVRKVMNANKGGVIFIDEAYTLAGDAEGRKAIEELVPMLTNELKDTVVILAGYKGRMNEFMNVNEGLKSRFPKQIDFKDYSASQMRQIADEMLIKREYTATKPAAVAAMEDAVAQIAALPKHSNGRDVSNFVNHARDAQELRLSQVENPTKAQLAELTADDIKYAMVAMGMTPTSRRKAS